MKHQLTEFYYYLIYLQKYLLGDIEKFVQLCEEAEKAEQAKIEIKKNSGNKKTPFTTNTATIFPESFEFLYGEPIIARSTIPHTMTLFAIIDLLGFLTGSGKDYGSTFNNFNTFFCGFKKNIDGLEVTVLRNIYRNGIAHNYFPKLNVAIAYRSEYPEDKIFLKKDGGLILNVKSLMKIVTERLEEIINDESLYPKMEKQYKILIASYEEKSSKDINELKFRLY